MVQQQPQSGTKISAYLQKVKVEGTSYKHISFVRYASSIHFYQLNCLSLIATDALATYRTFSFKNIVKGTASDKLNDSDICNFYRKWQQLLPKNVSD